MLLKTGLTRSLLFLQRSTFVRQEWQLWASTSATTAATFPWRARWTHFEPLGLSKDRYISPVF
jgi:hypothetical protein